MFVRLSRSERGQGTMKTLEKLHEALIKIVTISIIILFLLMFGITNLNVIMRYFFNKPITFAVEMGRYCFVSIIFLGAIITTKEDRHIQVDFITGMLPLKVRFIIEQVGRVCMTAFFAMLSFHTFRMALANVAVKSSAMQIPMAVPYFVMGIGCVGISLESLLNVYMYQTGKKIKKHSKESEDLAS